MLFVFVILFLKEFDLLQGYINISVDESFKLFVVDLEDSPNWNHTILEANVSSFKVSRLVHCIRLKHSINCNFGMQKLDLITAEDEKKSCFKKI